MSVVRELFARLAVDTDRGSFAGANQALTGLAGSLRGLDAFVSSLGIGASLAGATYALGSVVKAASSANENLNVLNQSFEGSTQAVLDWAKNTSEEVGRSEYKLREMAGTLGALLTPMLGGATDESAKMSTEMAKLAVDMASFFDSTESEALNALRAGLVGESEPLRRFGVLLSEARVQEEALAMGLAKDKKHISNAAKVQAIFALIMKDTVKVQGDALRTTDSYANVMRRFDGAVWDAEVTFGQVFLPALTAGLKIVTSWTKAIAEVVSKSAFFETAMAMAGVAAAWFGGRMMLANASTLLWAAGVLALFLIVEDFISMLMGKDSVIGDFLQSLIGKEAWKEIRATWIGASEAIGEAIYDWTHGIEGAWGRMFDHMADAAMPLVRILEKVWDGLVKVGASWNTSQDEALAAFGKTLGADMGTFNAKLTAGTSGAAVALPGGRGGLVQHFDSNVNVSVSGGADRGTANEIGRVVRRELDAQASKVARTASSTEAR